MGILNKIINEVTLLFSYKSIINGLNKIIDEQNSLVDTLSKDEIIIYNAAALRVLGSGYKMEKFAGKPEFWNGKLGIKSVKKVQAYVKNKDMVEVLVTFGNVDTTYYWYFLKLNEER